MSLSIIPIYKWSLESQENKILEGIGENAGKIM